MSLWKVSSFTVSPQSFLFCMKLIICWSFFLSVPICWDVIFILTFHSTLSHLKTLNICVWSIYTTCTHIMPHHVLPQRNLRRTHASSLLIENPQHVLGDSGEREEALLDFDGYRKDLGLSLLKLDYCFLPVVWLTDSMVGCTDTAATMGEDLSRSVNLLHWEGHLWLSPWRAAV